MPVKAETLQAILDALAGLRLGPITFARVFLAIGPSLLDEEPEARVGENPPSEPETVIETKGSKTASGGNPPRARPNGAEASTGAQASTKAQPTTKAQPMTRAADGRFAAGQGKGRLKWTHNNRDRNIDRVEEAQALLREALKAGPRSASEIDDMAHRRGISTNALGRAKSELGITARRMDRGAGHIVYLFAPQEHPIVAPPS
jgi:hypothetical protein